MCIMYLEPSTSLMKWSYPANICMYVHVYFLSAFPGSAFNFGISALGLRPISSAPPVDETQKTSPKLGTHPCDTCCRSAVSNVHLSLSVLPSSPFPSPPPYPSLLSPSSPSSVKSKHHQWDCRGVSRLQPHPLSLMRTRCYHKRRNMQKRCGQEENLPIYWYDSRNPLRSVCMLKDTCVGVDFV